MKVLIVVDVQNDFCPGGALAVPEGSDIIAGINSLMRSGHYDAIFATRDYHPSGHMSFASTHPGQALFDVIENKGQMQVLWPDHCVQGTKGAELHPDLKRELLNAIVDKGRDLDIDSYSGFFDNQRSSETALRTLITDLCTDKDVEVDICGLALDYCVAATARDAASLGFKTTVLFDLTRAVEQDPKKIAKLIRDLQSEGIRTIMSSERGLANGMAISAPEKRQPGLKP